VGGQGRLRAEEADSDEERGELHGPHGGSAQYADVDRGVFLTQLEGDEGPEGDDSGDTERPRPPRILVELEEGEPARDEQQRDGEDGESDPVEAAPRLGLRLGHAE